MDRKFVDKLNNYESYSKKNTDPWSLSRLLYYPFKLLRSVSPLNVNPNLQSIILGAV
jgi:hypothetical protein